MKQWKRDGLLILALLAATALLWLFFRPGDAGSTVVVTLSGEEFARYSLSEDQTITIGGEDYNILTILDGEAYISQANCGDHTCVRTGKISRSGQQIICLPHGLVIEVIGGESSGIDAATN